MPTPGTAASARPPPRRAKYASPHRYSPAGRRRPTAGASTPPAPARTPSAARLPAALRRTALRRGSFCQNCTGKFQRAASVPNRRAFGRRRLLGASVVDAACRARRRGAVSHEQRRRWRHGARCGPRCVSNPYGRASWLAMVAQRIFPAARRRRGGRSARCRLPRVVSLFRDAPRGRAASPRRAGGGSPGDEAGVAPEARLGKGKGKENRGPGHAKTEAPADGAAGHSAPAEDSELVKRVRTPLRSSSLPQIHAPARADSAYRAVARADAHR